MGQSQHGATPTVPSVGVCPYPEETIEHKETRGGGVFPVRDLGIRSRSPPSPRDAFKPQRLVQFELSACCARKMVQ